MNTAVDLRLWNPKKKGTLIIGSPRFGTHFLKNLVVHTVGEKNCSRFPENFDIHDNNLFPLEFHDRMQKAVLLDLYSVLIINDTWQKLMLLSNAKLLDSWHTIRVTHMDKIRWFISYWCYFRDRHSKLVDKENGKFYHHATPSDFYSRYISTDSKIPLNRNDILAALSSLNEHTVSYGIEVDEEIDYSNLKNFQNNEIRWLENQYPTLNLEDMFSNVAGLKKILTLWSEIPITGRFKKNLND